MPARKRTRSVADRPDQQLRASKCRRCKGTQEDPIDLDDAVDDNVLTADHNTMFELRAVPQENAAEGHLVNLSSDGIHSTSSQSPALNEFSDAIANVADEQHVEMYLPGYSDLDDCLRAVLDMYPDIAHNHVTTLWARCDGMIQTVLETILTDVEYPKERDQKAKEDKMDSKDADELMYTDAARPPSSKNELTAMYTILSKEFPELDGRTITMTINAKLQLYSSYLALDEMCDPNVLIEARNRPFFEDDITRSKPLRPVVASFRQELLAVRRKCSGRQAQYRKERQQAESARRAALLAKMHEAENDRTQRALGLVAECAVCCDESPQNRMIVCNAFDSHFTCYDCFATYIKCEVGQSRCRLTCAGSSACPGAYTELQIRLLPDKHLVDRLMQLQLEQDMREAGISDVTQCPFCDYMAVCVPIETDFEFRCQNSDCKIVSCRKCNNSSHTPDSCEEAALKMSKDKALTQRHKIEEAMSNALMRCCNNCKKPFIKESGCNKMTCGSCGNLQCYVCGESVKDYRHFEEPKPCPLFDLNIEDRHEAETKKAEQAARELVQAENPDIAAAALGIEVSEKVKKDDEARRQRAQRAQVGGGPRRVLHRLIGEPRFPVMFNPFVPPDPQIQARNSIFAEGFPAEERARILAIQEQERVRVQELARARAERRQRQQLYARERMDLGNTAGDNARNMARGILEERISNPERNFLHGDLPFPRVAVPVVANEVVVAPAVPNVQPNPPQARRGLQPINPNVGPARLQPFLQPPAHEQEAPAARPMPGAWPQINPFPDSAPPVFPNNAHAPVTGLRPVGFPGFGAPEFLGFGPAAQPPAPARVGPASAVSAAPVTTVPAIAPTAPLGMDQGYMGMWPFRRPR